VDALEDLRGQVVVIDFWATWCPWCIRSFPAIRDLLRDYADRGLAVVGVTAPASSVYEQRYDLDDDLKARAVEAGPPRPVARLAGAGPDREDGIPALAEAEYRIAEQEAIGRFVRNHELSWPVVLIDAAEPSARFALSGWPHAVVVDRAGRVRYFKPGALLRDRTEQVAAFRKVLEDLLAEPAPAAD
jgi:thiol-disulfide isomerase/thioredoxin